MVSHAAAPSAALVFVKPAATMAAFQRAQPWPRYQVAISNPRRRRNSSRWLPRSSVRIAGRVADGNLTKVDDATELAIGQEQIADGNVAMDPHRITTPLRSYADT